MGFEVIKFLTRKILKNFFPDCKENWLGCKGRLTNCYNIEKQAAGFCKTFADSDRLRLMDLSYLF